MVSRLALVFLVTALSSCISSYVRFPSSVAQVYGNADMTQSLVLAAQNRILFYIPESTTREFEKTEIDSKCRSFEEPIWSSRLSVYLNELRKRPELFEKFHILELVRGDVPSIKVQSDLDGVVTLSIQFAKSETYGKVVVNSKLPCKGSVAEFLGKELIKTNFEFPENEKLVLKLKSLSDKKDAPRFKFSTGFTTYLAERGAIFKFNHEMSFEKTAQGKFIMAEMFDRLSDQVKAPFHQNINYWFKQINEQSQQARLIQMFALVPDKEIKSGVKVDVSNDLSLKRQGESDLTYLYLTYTVDDDQVRVASLENLEKCLQTFTKEMSGFKFRKPAATGNESYLKPGYSCTEASGK
jgi:hypothetical protein